MRRREMLAGIGMATLSGRAALAAGPWLSPQLPDGTRAIARFGSAPGTTKLIELTDRPPNYEAPIGTFRTAITPNDEFFIRYHLAEVPEMAALASWKLTIGGDAATKETTLTLDDLKAMPAHEITAVCQCSGNRRGLFSPHVPGVEWGFGAMGCAVWRGPRLKDVLARAGVKDNALEVWMNGADSAPLPSTPDFIKSLPTAKAMSDETIIALTMNGAPLPWGNGYPARVVVPGWTATYWMKHVAKIDVMSKPLDSFWMQKAYRVPAGMFAVDHPFPSQDTAANWPITEMVVNSLIAAPVDGDKATREGLTVEGVAWDRGHGIRGVEVSVDDGKTWQKATLGKDLGPYAFRAFTFKTGKLAAGRHVLSARATSNSGETQAETLKFNPAGYHHNVPQKVAVTVT